jgi:hypothetical protein
MVEPEAPRAGSSRRELLLRAGAGAAALTLPGWLGACGGSGREAHVHPGAGEWKRFSGTTLNFISENTAPTSAIAANLKPFRVDVPQGHLRQVRRSHAAGAGV